MMPASYIHLLAGGEMADPFTARLHAALTAASLAAPAKEDLFDFVLTDFENCDFNYASALLTRQVESWHTIYFGPASSELSIRDAIIFCARSLVDALSFALGELDREREMPNDVKVSGSTIEMRRNGQLLLRIAPLVFESPNPVARQRIENDLKGLRQYGAEAHICARLSKIPGLEQLGEFERPGRPREVVTRLPFGPVICKTAASIASGLRKGLLERFKLEVKLSKIQEIFAESAGAANWAHLVSREDQPLCWLNPSYVWRSGADDESAYRFYRTPAEGIWGIAQAMRQYPPGALASPIWSGKTSFGHGVHIHAGLQATPVDNLGMRENVISLNVAPTVDRDPDYGEVAEGIVADYENLSSALVSYFGLEMPAAQRIAAASRRLGVAHEDSVLIGEWLFTFRTSGIYPFLHAERFDSDGQLLAKHRTVAYKAQIQYEEETKICLIAGDYANRVDIPLLEFSVEQVATLSAFCEGRMDHRIHALRHQFVDAKLLAHAGFESRPITIAKSAQSDWWRE